MGCDNINKVTLMILIILLNNIQYHVKRDISLAVLNFYLRCGGTEQENHHNHN